MRSNLILALCLALPAAFAAPVHAQTIQPPRHISVTGEGRVDVAPDMASIALSVTSAADTAAEVLAANSANMARVLAFLKATGLEDRDIQTSGLMLNPRYSDSILTPFGAPKITGYFATNTVSVRVRALDKLGGILDAVVSEGANGFNGLSFGLQEPGPKIDEARRLAVVEARRRAEVLAEAAGVKLGAILSISDGGGFTQPMDMQMERSFGKGGDVPVAQGELTVMAHVSVVFAIAE